MWLWQRVAPLAGVAGPSIMVAPWPQAEEFPSDAAAESDVRWIQAFVLGVRQIRGEMDISPSRRLPVLLEQASATDRHCAETHRAFLERLAGLESLRLLPDAEVAPPSATALMGGMRVLVPMAGLIDPQAELARLGKRIAKTREEIGRARGKLGNDSFVRNAPGDVVAQEQARLADFEQSLANLEQQLQRVERLL